MYEGVRVGVAIPSIPIRRRFLKTALDSVYEQTLPVSAVAVAIDNDHEGAGPTRTRAKNMLLADPSITHIALLDDDDTMKPNHIRDVLGTLLVSGKDLAFSWFDVAGGTDPIAELEHLPWDDARPHSFGITTIMTAEAARSTDFGSEAWEDWFFFKELLAKGFKFVHHYDRTWVYNHASGNTSGRPDRWV